ncbi:MAG: hypothetical protein K2G67_03075 [Muribaculaceae bacterium]|nr:hypothetical protein [Muribaculaceae bacterium]
MKDHKFELHPKESRKNFICIHPHIRLMLALLLSMLTPLAIYSHSKELSTVKYISISYEGNEELDPPIRQHQNTVPCSIDSNAGVRLMGEGDVDIISYEIWEIGGMCISEFGNEEDFIEILFKLSGDYEVRFITAEFTYIGIITL